MSKPTKPEHHVRDFKALRWLASFVKPYRGVFALLILLTFLLGALAPFEPYLVQLTIDRYIVAGDYPGLVKMALLMVAIVVIQGVVQYAQTYLGDWLGQRVIKDTRTQLYTYILLLRTRFFSQTPIGRLVTRNISDTEMLSNLFRDGITALMGELLQMLFMMALMFYINWRLALLSLATMPLIFAFTYVFKEKIKQAFGAVRNAVSQLSSFVQERIVGMVVVQIFGQEQYELARFKKLNQDQQDAGIRAVEYYALYFPLLNVMNSASISLLIWYGAKDVLHGTVTLGELTAFLMYINLLFRPLHLIADRFNTLQMGIVSIDRIVQLLENGEQVNNTGAHVPQRVRGDIAFQNVWFAYEGDHYVLKDISFHLEAQKSMAIVGATGAGKSTLINLLDRFYDIQKGVIRIDGVDIKDYELQGFRKHVGLVLQDVFLFSGSVHENITLGDSSISRKQVIEAARLVGMHDFIVALPGGYDYNVMERGMTLSMGQRQLLSFARMLVYDPAILILDEATASLDTESERLIQKAMATLMQNRTSILIAHRLATIQQADKILVLNEGKLQEEGTHTSLLAQKGYYAALHQAS